MRTGLLPIAIAVAVALAFFAYSVAFALVSGDVYGTDSTYLDCGSSDQFAAFTQDHSSAPTMNVFCSTSGSHLWNYYSLSDGVTYDVLQAGSGTNCGDWSGCLAGSSAQTTITYHTSASTPTPTPSVGNLDTNCPNASGSYDPFVCLTANGGMISVFGSVFAFLLTFFSVIYLFRNVR